MSLLPRSQPLVGLIAGFFVLLACLFLSVSYGAADISWQNIYESLISFDGSREHLIIRTIEPIWDLFNW